MKNVLIINQFASLPQYSFGAGERIYHLSEFLFNEGFNVEVISGSYNHLFKEYPVASGLFTVEKTKYLMFIWVRLKKYKHTSFVGRVFSWFEFLIKLFLYPITKAPDIVLVSSMSLLPILYALWIKKKYKSKFILEIRDIWPMTPINIGGYSKYNPLMFFLRKVELLGYKRADYIISVLPGFEKYLIENVASKKPFLWIPNGVSIPTNTISDIKRNILKGKFNVIYAGTFGVANALEPLLEAARVLKNDPEIHITLIGDGPLELKLKEQASDLQNVSFLPKVLKSELSSILLEADVCYIGWLNKNIYTYGVSANKYNDYMLAKKPILSSSNIKNDPVNMSNSGIQVPANDTVAISNGIIKLFELEESKRAEMGLRGYNFVIENQTYPTLSKKYISVLNKVLNI